MVALRRAPHSSAVTAEPLRHAAAAVLKFLSAAARARLVAADFWRVATHRREIELQLGTVAIRRNLIAHRWHPLAMPAGDRTGGGCCARRLFLEKKLRQSGEEILEGLQVRSAAEEVVEDFVLNVRHQLDEHFVSLGLVFDERIFLGVTA